jgi:hypothetical protein
VNARFALLLSMTLLAQCSSNEDTKEIVRDPVFACVERGVDYFKKIRSYPTLRSEPNVGRGAEDVALERCRRAIDAF